MSEGIITGTIYETRLRDKNCCLRYGKKKKKKYEMHHVIVLLVISGCPRLSDWFSA